MLGTKITFWKPNPTKTQQSLAPILPAACLHMYVCNIWMKHKHGVHITNAFYINEQRNSHIPTYNVDMHINVDFCDILFILARDIYFRMPIFCTHYFLLKRPKNCVTKTTFTSSSTTNETTLWYRSREFLRHAWICTFDDVQKITHYKLPAHKLNYLQKKKVASQTNVRTKKRYSKEFLLSVLILFVIFHVFWIRAYEFDAVLIRSWQACYCNCCQSYWLER